MASMTVVKTDDFNLHFKSKSRLNTTTSSSSSSKPYSHQSHNNNTSIYIPNFGAKHILLHLQFRSKLTPQFQSFVTSSSSKCDSGGVIYSHSFGAKTVKQCHFRSKLASKSDITESLGEGEVDGNGDGEIEEVEVEIEKVGRNRRRIRSKVAIDATLETVWGILTDYERLADYIPGLVVSQVLDKQTNFARLLQIGQQNLAFGLKFNAKGVVDCFEKDFEVLPYGQRRDIDFKMIEGDFDLFEGTWSIEQSTDDTLEQSQRYRTTLSYTVDVVPKIWLPVQLVEGRLFKEIKMNLFSIREVAQKISDTISAG